MRCTGAALGGFLFLFALFAVLPGCDEPDPFADRLEQYHRLGRLSLALERAEAGVNGAGLEIYRFLRGENLEHALMARQELELAEKQARDAERLIIRPVQRNALLESREYFERLNGLFSAIQGDFSEARGHYLNVVQPTLNLLDEALWKTARESSRATDELLAITETLATLGVVRAHLVVFIEFLDAESAQRIRHHLEAAQGLLRALPPHPSADNAFTLLMDGFRRLDAQVAGMSRSVAEMERNLESLRRIFSELRAGAADEFLTYGESLRRPGRP